MDDKIKMLKVKENYHQIFECPVCKEFMVAPILFCTKGHSICSLCKEKIKNCPLCKEEFISGRNFSLELLAESITFPCENSGFGCHETVFLNNMDDHHKQCPYRLYECIVGKQCGCEWKGRRTDILAHVEKKHNNFILVKQSAATIVRKNFKLDQNSENPYIISAYGEVFWFQTFVSLAKKGFYISFHYIGSKENCCNYFYKIHCTTTFKSSEHEILFTTRTHPDSVNIKDLIEDNIACFCLKHDIAEFFLHNGNLIYNLEIIKLS